MSDPIRAFFIGRATAETLIESLEDTVTDLLSALGKFDAEQREKLRTLTQTILEKAERAEHDVARKTNAAPVDLQEIIDNLRAEIAQLKAELQLYREGKD